MENKAFNSSCRFGKWMRKYHLKWGMYKVLSVQTHMRQVQRHVFGRSMIEMLGVLAIIGVLSIGGLYAYRQAMDKHRTNEIMNFIGKIRFVISETCPDKISGCPLFRKTSSSRSLDLCALIEECVQDKTTYARLVYFPMNWYPYRNEQDHEYSFNLFIGSVPKKFCRLFGMMSFPKTNSVLIGTKASEDKIVYTTFSLYPDGRFRNTNALKEITDICDSDEYAGIVILYGLLNNF